MARESSAKKVARVAQSQRARGRSIGRQRRLGFPLLIAGIITVGLALVFVARGERESTAGERPLLNVATSDGGVQGDHWHSPYGVYLCTTGEFEPPYVDTRGDEVGIHTHADGFIHIHPHSTRARGSRATLGVFFDEIGVDAGEDEWELPDGTTLANGDDCADGSDGEWRVYRWDDAADDEPQVFEGGFDRISLRDDGEIYTIAFAGDDYEPERPPTATQTADGTDLVVDDEGEVVSPDVIPDAETEGAAEDEGGAIDDVDTEIDETDTETDDVDTVGAGGGDAETGDAEPADGDDVAPADPDDGDGDDADESGSGG